MELGGTKSHAALCQLGLGLEFKLYRVEHGLRGDAQHPAGDAGRAVGVVKNLQWAGVLRYLKQTIRPSPGWIRIAGGETMEFCVGA